MTASTTIANLSNGTVNLDITFIKLEQDYDKQLAILSIPKNTDSNNLSPTTSTENPLNLLIDLKRLKQVVTITGYLLEETASTALAKKDILEVILTNGGLLTLTWLVGTTTITRKGTIIKIKITEIPNRIGDDHPATQGKSLMVTLQFAVGKVKG